MVTLKFSSTPLLSRPRSGVSHFLNQSRCGRFLHWILQFKYLIIYDTFTDQEIQIPINNCGWILNNAEFCVGSVIGDHLCIVSSNLKNCKDTNLYTLSVFRIDLNGRSAELADQTFFINTRLSMSSTRSISQNGNFYLLDQQQNNILSFQILNVFKLAEPKRTKLISGVEFVHGIDVFTVDWDTQTAYAFIFHDKTRRVYSIDLKTNKKCGQIFKLDGDEPPEKECDGPQQWHEGCFYYSHCKNNKIVYLSKFDPISRVWEQIDFDQSANLIHFTVDSCFIISMVESFENSQQFKSHRVALTRPESLKHLSHCVAKKFYPALLKLSKEQQARVGFLPAYIPKFEQKSRSTHKINYLQVFWPFVFIYFLYFLFKSIE